MKRPSCVVSCLGAFVLGLCSLPPALHAQASLAGHPAGGHTAIDGAPAVPSAAGRMALDAQRRRVSGTVLDASGRPISGATVVLTTPAGSRETLTEDTGRFAFDDVPDEEMTVTVTFDKFSPVTVALAGPRQDVHVVLQPGPIAEAVTVLGRTSAAPRSITTATRTDTLLRDTPQAVSVISRGLIDEQAMRGMADVLRYVPGVGVAQGEGHRDAPIFRGNASTSDFLVDGIRDDTQYLRDLYNVQRVEVLKGPNGMIFGRGGVGGVINRVTRQADWIASREITLQAGAWGQRRISGDLGHALNGRVALRLTGLFEDSDTYRDGATLERHAANPTLAVSLGPRTMLRAGYEYFQDARTVDRGIPSLDGRPLEIDRSTFFGSPDVNRAEVSVNALASSVEHTFGDRVTLTSRLRFAAYDKFYQNLVPGAVNPDRATVRLTGYNNTTDRQNLFSQTDLVVRERAGGMEHVLLAGIELGRQVTDNRRQTGFFTGPGTTGIDVPLDSPRVSVPVTFSATAADATNDGTATVAAFYAQDQIALTDRLQAIVGLRYDRFRVSLLDRRTVTRFSSDDGLLSPRLALLYKPRADISLYGSYARAYLPRAGEQLSSLTPANEALDPETFRNYEVGMKWDLTPSLSFTTAAYRLDHGNVVVRDPLDPTISHLVDAERTSGVELELSGSLLPRWTVHGGYAYQNGEITRSLSPAVAAGAKLGQVPAHSLSLWNKYDITRKWGAGLGVISQSDSWIATDNAVVLPGFVRVDAAVFVTLAQHLRAHVNLENLFDARYYASAHNNNNITPGSPRALRVTLVTSF